MCTTNIAFERSERPILHHFRCRRRGERWPGSRVGVATRPAPAHPRGTAPRRQGPDLPDRAGRRRRPPSPRPPPPPLEGRFPRPPRGRRRARAAPPPAATRELSAATQQLLVYLWLSVSSSARACALLPTGPARSRASAATAILSAMSRFPLTERWPGHPGTRGKDTLPDLGKGRGRRGRCPATVRPGRLPSRTAGGQRR